MSKQQLLDEQKILLARYNDFKAKNLSLDMSRGKPGADQLDLSNAMNEPIDYVENGFDVRNYGLLDGIPSCKKLFSVLSVKDISFRHVRISSLKIGRAHV